MMYNCSFTSYRIGVSGSARTWSGTATLTNQDGFIEPAGGELKAVLGLDNAVDAWSLLTEATNIQRTDKLVISSVNYYVEQLEQIAYGGVNLTRLVLLKKND